MEATQIKKCPHCQVEMTLWGTETIEMFGCMSLLYSGPFPGGLTVDIWECPQCHHLDFYRRDLRQEDPLMRYMDEHADEMRKRHAEAMEIARNPGAYLKKQKQQKDAKTEESDNSSLSDAEPKHWHPFRRKKKNDGDLW